MPTPLQTHRRRWSTASLIVLLGASTLVMAACGSGAEPAADPEPAPTAEPASAPAGLDRAILDDPSRPDPERAQDEGRNPLGVYEFFGIQPGQTVADVYNYDGYNTHLLSRAVGDEGTVYSVFEFYSERELLDGRLYKVDAVTERVDSAGLYNVALAMRLSEVPEESVDVAIAIRNYHDVEWVFADIKRVDQLAEFFRIVKPGGIVGIVEASTPKEGWDQDLHRLNKQVVIDDFTGAGFELVEESDMLANPDDQYNAAGFEEGRWTTDRYVLKFRKPGN